jgi:hypothetical protein
MIRLKAEIDVFDGSEKVCYKQLDVKIWGMLPP